MYKNALLSLLFILPIISYADPYEVILEQGNLPILSPAFKEQTTAKIRLNNGLEAFLISDPNTKLSGAMLSVNAGSWEDPDEYPGLAHFLEHMLFMGTKKYPDEAGYSKFITQHGGQSNAFTSSNSTNYLFTVQSEFLPEALDRFTSFFKEPLFNPSGVDRELKAIDQEYSKNIENDAIRQLYVLKELSNTNHPFHKFNMGNSETLSNVSQETLKEWYQEHYSANLMKIIVYSALPIEELKQLVVQDLQNVSSNERKSFTTNHKAFSDELEGQMVFIEPIKDSRSLSIFWEVPPKFADMIDEKPEEIISFVLGHEGGNSLLAQLKREKLAESLAAGGARLGNNLFVVYVQIELTDDGLRDVDQVMTRTFQSLKNFRIKGVPQHLFDELNAMNRIQYQYQSKENEFYALLKHGYDIQNEEMTTYPEKTKVIQTFDPNAVQEMLEVLTPENGRFLVMAPEKLTHLKSDQKEKWLGVDYSIKPIPTDLYAKLKLVVPHAEIDLPSTNPFIPQDLRVINGKEELKSDFFPQPIRLIDDSISKAWYAQDKQFGVPKVSWTFQVKTPQIHPDDPSKFVFADIYVKLLEDSLDRFSYPAKLAGLEYTIERKNNGIEVSIDGYSENARYLYEEIIKQMVEMKPTQEKFKIFKDSLIRKYQNASKESPLKQSIEIFKSVLYQDFVTDKEKASVMRKITFKKFTEWLNELFDQTYTEAVFYGNVTEADANEAIGLMREAFYNGIYPVSKQLHEKVIVLPETEGPFFLESRTKAQGNAALLAIESDDFSFKERAMQQILMQAIQQPFFNTLRTKQQTGYLVHSLSEEVERKLFNLFIVQSNTHDTRDLLSRFETFIEGYLQELGKTELTESQFEMIKSSQIKQLQEPAKNVKEMGKLINHIAFKYDGNFDWMEERIKGFQSLTYPEFIQKAKEMLGRTNKQRLAVLLNGEIPEENNFSYSKARTWNSIRKMSEYEGRIPKKLITNGDH